MRTDDDDDDANVKHARTTSGEKAGFSRPERLEGGSGREGSSLPVERGGTKLSGPPFRARPENCRDDERLQTRALALGCLREDARDEEDRRGSSQGRPFRAES